LLDAAARDAVLERAQEAGLDCVVTDDLCHLAGRRDERLAELVEAPHLWIAACHPRAVRWLLHRGGVDLPPDRVTWLDLRAAPPADAAEMLPAPAPRRTTARTVEPADDWPAWFPVLDLDRCTHCGKCLSFCLFGVFAKVDGKVVVRQPHQCKTNCPACARVCPQTAIVFPKYKSAPVNGGEDQADAPEPAGVDVGELAKKDVYDVLRRRAGGANRTRFAPAGAGGEVDQSDAAQRLRALQEKLDIPDEVLDSLESPRKDTGPRS